VLAIFNVFAWLTETIFGLERVPPLKSTPIIPPNPYKDYRWCHHGKKGKSFHITEDCNKTLCGYGNVNNVFENEVEECDLTEHDSENCKKCLKSLNNLISNN